VNLIVKTPHARDIKMYEEYDRNGFQNVMIVQCTRSTEGTNYRAVTEVALKFQYHSATLVNII